MNIRFLILIFCKEIRGHSLNPRHPRAIKINVAGGRYHLISKFTDQIPQLIYGMKKELVTYLLIILFLPSFVIAQQTQERDPEYYKGLVQFTGAVVTGDSLHPVPFTHIMVRNTIYGTICDYYGYFSFVAHKGDTIDFSAVGFKKGLFVIPDTMKATRYTMFQVMTADTIYLPETVIYPWPSREQFKEAFLSLDIPDDDLEIARKNLELYELKARGEAMPMDGSMNFRNMIDQRISKNYYAGQVQPYSIFDAFAWAKFFQAWREGKFKRKKSDH